MTSMANTPVKWPVATKNPARAMGMTTTPTKTSHSHLSYLALKRDVILLVL